MDQERDRLDIGLRLLLAVKAVWGLSLRVETWGWKVKGREGRRGRGEG